MTWIDWTIIGAYFLLVVGILAALMSSLDSAINSLSAASMKDFYCVYIRPDGSDRHYNRVSRLLTGFWGVFCVVAAVGFTGFGDSTRQTTIVLINAVGSLLYGPILATFLVGIATRSVRAGAIGAGIVAGIGANLILWRWTDVSWLWWNVAGFVLTVSIALLVTVLGRMVRPSAIAAEVRSGLQRTAGRWRTAYSVVLIYFVTIISLSWAAQFLG